jgi:YD repeat-containing protein
MLDASPDDRTERFAYDNLNRMRVRISAEGTVSAYEYDAAGNQIKVTDFLSQ